MVEERIKLEDEDIDIYGLDRQPIEWFVRFHVHNGKKEAEQLKSQILQDHEIVNQTTKILINHCGETGKNEGLIETLQRLSEIVNRLRERIKDLVFQINEYPEWQQKEHMMNLVVKELQKIMEEKS